jgi:glycosyltransferase involved in cell wall biosynthesis
MHAMIKQLSVSLVIPMFNEEGCIEGTVKTLRDFFNSLGLNFEIIVIDDGSTDGSFRILEDLRGDYSSLRVIRLAKNTGIGRALRTGFEGAKHDVIIYTDADLPVQICGLKKGLDMLLENNADIVVGSRVGKRESLSRLVYTSVYNFIIRHLFRLDVQDVNCAMKIIRRSKIKEACLRSEGPFIDAEILIKAKNIGLKILEIEVENVPRKDGFSKFASNKTIIFTIFKMLSELLMIYPDLIHPRIEYAKINH